MAWRDWTYWLKGGIIGVILGILVSLAFLFGLTILSLPGIILAYILAPVDQLLLVIFAGNNGYVNETVGYLFITISAVIEFFVIGAIIGLIYGKIKKK